jgi:hypothetical protein
LYSLLIKHFILLLIVDIEEEIGKRLKLEYNHLYLPPPVI